jgi:predicted nucleotidyltransferase
MKTINIKDRIKEYFFINPTIKLRVRQIERELNLPLPSVIRYIKELNQEQILKAEMIAKIRLYSADRSSDVFLTEKRLYNIKTLTPVVNFLIDKYNNPTIVLFGSYSRGEDTEDSDIDLFIETPIKKQENLEKFEKKLNRKIQLFKYRRITSIKNKNLINNILNGITLNGFVEVFK